MALTDAPPGGVGAALRAATNSPSSVALTGERAAALRHALDRFSEPSRSVTPWRNYERCTFEEIGQRRGRSAEAARKVWTRALEQPEQFREPSEGPR
jgi:RNA polymerase sigma-70 factor (ECF subfamily)